jgi:ABC-type transport system involved in cytochrome c biogenesis permease subunit
MKMNPNTIIAGILGGIALLFLMRYQAQAAAFLATVNKIGPGNSSDDMTLGLIVIGFAGAVLVAIVRILTNNNKNN